MNTPFEWNPETEARLFELWKAGHAGSVIANIMRAPSRSAVIGKLHRLGYTAKHPDAPARTKDMISARGTRTRIAGGGHGGKRVAGGVVTAPVKRQPVAKLMTSAAIFPIQMNPTRFLDLTAKQCRFPIDDINTPGSADTLFCGAYQRDGSSYCEHHHARCMTPYKRAKKPRDRSGFIARDKFVFGVAA
jgi:GcrA cell cycle regulator